MKFVLVLIMFVIAPIEAFAQSKPTGPLRIGVVGLVHGHARGLFGNFRKHPEVEIVGIAEPNSELVAKYSDQYQVDRSLFFAGLEEMLDKSHPQAVVVYTNTFDHLQVVQTCAKRGVHVMMEKPLAVSLEHARAMAKAAADAKILVFVNYETTWYRSNAEIYNLAVRDKTLGEIRKIVVHDGHRGPKEINVPPEFFGWLTDPKLAGAGALFDFGCYGADLATWLLKDQRPISVTAVTQQIRPDEYPHVDDEATIIVTYPKAQAIFQASWNWPYNRKDTEVYGTDAYAIAPDGANVLTGREGQKQEAPHAAKPLAMPYDHPLSYLKAVVLDGAQQDVLSSLDTNVTVMEILDAARESAATGRTVHLPEK
jgi:predicted dehydrogenase